MSGERFAHLIYGPTIKYATFGWLEIFNLVDKREWVNRLIKEKYEEDKTIDDEEEDKEDKTIDDEEEIDKIFIQNFDEEQGIEYIFTYLEKYDLKISFESNVFSEYFSVGMEVIDYESFEEKDKQKVKDFCVMHNLPNPTFYAGMNGGGIWQ